MARSPSTESPPAIAGGATLGNPPPISSKPKPTIPPRTAGVGGKIAALKAGFMSDLDQRLKLGPQAPKKGEKSAEEEVKEKEVLSDIRKSRARGPRGRKLPTAKESESKLEEVRLGDGVGKMQVVEAWTVWSADEEGVSVNDKFVAVASEPEPKPKVEEVREDLTVPTPSTITLPEVSGVDQQAVSAVDKDGHIPTTPPATTVDVQLEKSHLATVIPDRYPEDAIETSGMSGESVDENKQEDVRNPEGDQKEG
jgi:hypothetical protein